MCVNIRVSVYVYPCTCIRLCVVVYVYPVFVHPWAPVCARTLVHVLLRMYCCMHVIFRLMSRAAVAKHASRPDGGCPNKRIRVRVSGVCWSFYEYMRTFANNIVHVSLYVCPRTVIRLHTALHVYLCTCIFLHVHVIHVSVHMFC